MRLTPERDEQTRLALAARVERGLPVPRHRTMESASTRGGGANPAFIRLDPATRRKRRRK